MFTVIFSHPMGTEKREINSWAVLQILLTSTHTNFRSCRVRSSLEKPTTLVKIAAWAAWALMYLPGLAWRGEEMGGRGGEGRVLKR